MHRYILSLACAIVLLYSAAPARAQQTKRIWTNADMDSLRARGLISIVGTESAPTPAPAAVAAPPTTTPGPVHASRLEDPAWYAEQAAGLQAQLTARQMALAQAQDNLVQARDGRGITGSFNMAAGNTFGVIPDDVIANLEVQVRETQADLDDLADLARRNSMQPGVARTTPA